MDAVRAQFRASTPEDMVPEAPGADDELVVRLTHGATTIDVVLHYHAASVAATLLRDIAAHGASLAYRLDRATCHDAPDVRAVLEAAGVLVLHGPPYHPWYYGQLERQSREHRAWLRALGTRRPPG